MSKSSKNNREVQETCSCGAGVVGTEKYALKWRKEHIHGDIREVQSATQLSTQEPEDPEEEYEDKSKARKFKIGFQIEDVTPNENKPRTVPLWTPPPRARAEGIRD